LILNGRRKQCRRRKLGGTWEPRLHLHICLEAKEDHEFVSSRIPSQSRTSHRPVTHYGPPTRFVENATHRRKAHESHAHGKAAPAAVSISSLPPGLHHLYLEAEDEAWMRY